MIDNELSCNVCRCSMTFVRRLSFEGGAGSYDLYSCPECQKSQDIVVEDSQPDADEFARLSLRVMHVLNTMEIDAVRLLVATLEDEYKKMN